MKQQWAANEAQCMFKDPRTFKRGNVLKHTTILLFKCLRKLGYPQEPVSKETMEISLFNQINLTKLLSNFYFGNHCHIKGKSSQHLAMKLFIHWKSSLTFQLVMFSVFLYILFWLQQKHLLGRCSEEQEKKLSITDKILPRTEL